LPRFLERIWANLAKRRMPAPQIVEPFDALEHIGPGVIARGILRSIRPFSLQRRKEALHCGIIPAITLPAQAAGSHRYAPCLESSSGVD
jgi:hypothetical protein